MTVSFGTESIPSTATDSIQTQDIQKIISTLPSEIKNHQLTRTLAIALSMGRQAGKEILAVKEFRDLKVETKADGTPVTAADKASNEVICKTIQHYFGQHGILSEETIQGDKSLSDAIKKGVDAEWTWVIDPLDGTKSFIKSIQPEAIDLDPRYQGKYYGVHIGLLHNGEPVMGVNYYPETQTLYYALDGFAYKQVKDAAAERIMNRWFFGIHPIVNASEKERASMDKIYSVLMGDEAAAEFKKNGLFLDSFGIKMIRIAEGDGCNLFIAPPGGPGFWDICSMTPFVEAAGGQVTDWQGNPINYRDLSKGGLLPNGAIISMNVETHQQIVEIISKIKAG